MNDANAEVFIVDDDPAARRSVAALVQSRGTRTREFASAEEFLAAAEGELKGCMVLDVRMKGMSGLDLQREMVERNITLPIIVITGYADVPTAVRAMQAGAVSFLTKPCEPERLWETISEALDRFRADWRQRERREELEQRLATLTEDEKAVLIRIMQGLPNKRIARDLDIGLRTAELRRSNLMKKMKADSLAQLVQLTVQAGFTLPDENA